MRLSAFILENMERILQDWEDFARSLGAVTSAMEAIALRDHAELMLRAVANDLETQQTPAQREAKAKGNAPERPSHLDVTAATAHGTGRAEDGFSLQQMVSEYRALRASVLRLWAIEEAASADSMSSSDSYEQQMRFHEAIDEALADSIKSYSQAIDQRMVSKARYRMESLGTLTAGLGHDMANVLLPMQTCLDGLVEEGLTPASAPLVEGLNRAINHLRGLTRGLRALSMDPDTSASSPDSTLLHEWWITAISPFTWALPPKVRLHAEGLRSTDNALPPVRVPEHVLMQAVFNLVQNAGQALGMRPGRGEHNAGNIWITARLQAGAPGVERAIHLTVRDDGPGMDASTAARCTEPFYTTKPKDRGTGLGLFLVRSAMDRHGGKLLIQSKLGEGAAFTLVLPVVDEVANTTKPSRAAANVH